MPALAFSFAMLDRFGPLDCVVDVERMPALALALDQRLPNASPPALPVAAAGLLAPTDGVD